MVRKVKLKDVVMRVKDKIDKDTTDLEFYVGGEHIDSGEISITKKGRIEGSTIGPAFHMHFMPGDVLLMSRNPHLKKAGVVDFEGICSDVSYICRTKDENVLSQQYLPFIFQTDHFWQFVEENKKGGLPFFLNWSDFEKYEFMLPDIDKQNEMANILWAAQDTKLAYIELLKQTDELVKSRFIELFGDLKSNAKGWDIKTFDELTKLITDGEHATPRRTDKGIYLLSARNILNHSIQLEDVDFIDQEEYDRIAKRVIPQEGDVLISCSGTVGRCCSVPADLKFQMVRSAALLRFKEEINPIFAEYMITSDYLQEQINSSKTASSQANLFQGKIKLLKGFVPPMDLQNEFLAFVKQVDKSKFEIKKSIENISELIKSLMQQDFTN